MFFRQQSRVGRSLGGFMACLLFCLPVQSENLVIATGEWPPYVSAHLKHQGVTAHIVREAFAAVGDTVEFRFFPWSRTMLMSEVGEVAASFPWSYQPDRAQAHLYSDAIGEYGYVFFHLKTTHFDWRQLDDLRGLTIGGTNSYNYGEAFVSGGEQGLFRLEWVSSDKLNWHKLLAGRIDLFPSDIEAGYAELRKLFPAETVNQVTHHPHPLKPLTTMHLLFPRQVPESADRLARFNEGLRRLREDGRMDQYLQRSRQGGYQN